MTMFSKFPGRCQACGCDFPSGTEIVWTRGVGARHTTSTQCGEAKKQRAIELSAEAPKLSTIRPIAEFLRAAQARGLKAPKLRVLDVDNRTELKLSLTRTGVAPGSIAIVRGGNFTGCIRPDDGMTGSFKNDTQLHRHLELVAQDPAKAAKDYAALMCRCSFCGLPLTDSGSVEVGYGPICAQKWGLPHTPQGTPGLQPVTGGPTPQQLLLIRGGRP